MKKKLLIMACAFFMCMGIFAQSAPQTADEYYGRGVEYLNNKDYDRAIEDFTQAIRLDTNHIAAYLSRGIAYYDKKDNEKAIADWEAALQIDPNNTNAKQLLATVKPEEPRRRIIIPPTDAPGGQSTGGRPY